MSRYGCYCQDEKGANNLDDGKLMTGLEVFWSVGAPKGLLDGKRATRVLRTWTGGHISELGTQCLLDGDHDRIMCSGIGELNTLTRLHKGQLIASNVGRDWHVKQVSQEILREWQDAITDCVSG